MKIDIDAYKAAKARLVQMDWDLCMMGVAVGHSINECVSAGWPKWLAEFGTYYFDNAQGPLFENGLKFLNAVQSANARGVDWDRVFRDLRLQAILPIAMDAISEGDETWRVECRRLVQWSMDNDGAVADAAWAAEALGAVGAVGAVRAAEPPGAAEADAWRKISNTFFSILRESERGSA